MGFFQNIFGLGKPPEGQGEGEKTTPAEEKEKEGKIPAVLREVAAEDAELKKKLEEGFTEAGEIFQQLKDANPGATDEEIMDLMKAQAEDRRLETKISNKE